MNADKKDTSQQLSLLTDESDWVLLKVLPDFTFLSVFYDPDVASKLKDWFVCYRQTINEIESELRKRLELWPDDTYCCVAMDMDGIPLAVLIAYCRENDVYVWQVKSAPGFKYCSDMVENFLSWVKYKGYSSWSLPEAYGFQLPGERIKNVYQNN